MVVKVSEVCVRSVFTKSRLPEADIVVNPYTGCAHGCTYCYAAFMKRFTGHREPWGEFVDVKINALELVPKDLRGKRILFSSVTDPYQPLEAKYRLTRGLLERLVGRGAKVEVLTKSVLVLRDADLLGELGATVGMSISTLREWKMLEPKASPPEARLRALEKLHSMGIRTYAFISPIIPGITELEEIVERAAPHVDFFRFESLNTRHAGRLCGIAGLRKSREYWEGVRKRIGELCELHGREGRVYFHHPISQ